MKKLILANVALFTIVTGFLSASPYSMGRYMNGEISCDQYLDSIGCPKAPTIIVGPNNETYTIYGR